MMCIRPLGLLLVTLPLAWCLPSENTTTVRSTPQFKETIKTVTNQLIDPNSTIPDVLDVRTPPKIKLQQKQKLEAENSVIGIAIPVDEDSVELEETTKKLHFYKIERPTTNSGLSTWILLSGKTASTAKPPPKKPSIKPVAENEVDKQNKTVAVSDKPNRIIKPIFKKRVTTTKPTTTTTTITAKPSKKASQTTVSGTTKSKSTTSKPTKDTTKLTKVKASVLNSAVNKKNGTNSTTASPNKKTTTISTTTAKITTVATAPVNSTTNSTIDSISLPAEAKEGDTDLSKTDKKKKNKRKKNKNRRRKPSNETALKIPEDKPISTQLYNYLSREIMPTVGVGLAGLMVAAGLASYFLYPFGIARRTYEIDRKDKEGGYYYNDEYSGGIPEEEAIGKVIAGMPENSLQSNNFRTTTMRNSYPNNVRYRQVDRRSQVYQNGMTQGTVENVRLTPKDREQGMYGLQSSYPSENQRFVVGSVPKDIMEEITPASVPEHGPRSLNLDNVQQFVVGGFKNEILDAVKQTKSSRRKRDIPDESENDIMSDGSTTTTTTTTTEKIEIATDNLSTTTEVTSNRVSILDVLRQLIDLKIRLGLELVQNATRTFASYVAKVQSRLNEHYNVNGTSVL